MARPALTTSVTLRVFLLAMALLLPAIGFTADDDAAAGVAMNRKKLERIIIPKLEFREATIREAIDFLKKQSGELDEDSPAGEKGVNIVLQLESAGGGGGTPGAPAAAPAIPGHPAEARITISLTNVTLGESLKYVTGLANLKFKVGPDAISIVPLTENTEVLITKEWKIPPDLIPRKAEAGPATSAPAAADSTSTTKGIADRVFAKSWLIANGVTFDGAATAIYIVRSSRLIVRNTQDQLDLVETILHEAHGVGSPLLVEIECQLVETRENTFKELTFDSILNLFNAPATKNVFISGGDIGSSPNQKLSDFPFAVPSSPSALVGVFTDPQFQLVLRALAQKKGDDVFSSPKVTVKSDQHAVIQVIREFRNPAEDVPLQIVRNGYSPAPTETTGETKPGGAGTGAAPPPPAHENRNLSVTLEVEPVVGPDGYTVDVNLTPQVAEFEGREGYGTPYLRTAANPGARGARKQIVAPGVAIRTLYTSPKVTTSVSVFDGSTVLLHALIPQDLPKAVAKGEELLLGNTPIIGPDRTAPGKRNFLLFVTVRLVASSSRPVRMEDERIELIERPLAPPPAEPPPIVK